MANKRIDQLTAAGSVSGSDLLMVANPSTGEMKKATRSQVVGNTTIALTDAATIAWNYTNGNIASVTLAGNRSLSLSNVPAGTFGILKVKQDATGGRTLTLPGNKKTGFALSTGANQEDILGFYYDGAAYYWSIDNYGTVSAGDTTAPTVVSATAINATTIRVVFSEVVTATNVGWSFKKNGAANNPTSVSGSGTTTLDFTVPTMAAGDTILRSYVGSTGNTLDAASNELADFTDSAVTNSIAGASLADVTYSTVNNLTQTGTLWTAATNGAQGLSIPKLAAGADGYYQQEYNSALNETVIMALDPDNTLEGFSSFKFGAYFVASGIRLVDAGAIVSSPNGTNRTPVAGDLLRLKRTSGTITIEWSSNAGSTWTVAHTFSTTDSAILYLKVNMTTSGQVIRNPKSYNAS